MINKCKAMAKDIYNELGIGYDECIYHKAFEVGLRLLGINYETKCRVPVFYRGYTVGEQEIDLIIRLPENKLIIELKATPEKIIDDNKAQLHRYMKLLGVQQGLLINFLQCGRSKKTDYSNLYISNNLEPEYYLGGYNDTPATTL